MIVKFLAKSNTFKGVRYNTNKIEKNKGELMKVSGFGPLQGLSQLIPQDYINYLKMVSARNNRIIYPQLHTVISAKGKDASKEELTEIAEKWLKQMGYADQPFLVIFHKDTRNHHVHIVSTRVDSITGKKISSAYEKIRAMTAINRFMKLDEKQVAKKDVDKAMGYNFQTKAQFMMILESKGYTLLEEGGKLQLIKFGRKLLEIDLDFLKQRRSNYQVDQDRASQITAFLHRYKQQYSPVLRPVTEPLPGGGVREKHGYTSDLAEQLRSRFGIQLIFHGSPGKAPFGYSILDHPKENVFKGGEIMDKEVLLNERINPAGLFHGPKEQEHSERDELNRPIEADIKSDKRYAEHPYNAFNTSADHQLHTSTGHQFNNSDTQQIRSDPAFEPFEQAIRINISDDIDDEAIYGRNRHRKRQVRTNTR